MAYKQFISPMIRFQNVFNRGPHPDKEFPFTLNGIGRHCVDTKRVNIRKQMSYWENFMARNTWSQRKRFGLCWVRIYYIFLRILFLQIMKQNSLIGYKLFMKLVLSFSKVCQYFNAIFPSHTFSEPQKLFSFIQSTHIPILIFVQFLN